jgi:arsenate reductase
MEFVPQKEALWIENFREENSTDKKIIRILANNPILIQCTVVLFNDIAIVASDLEELNDFI